MQVVKWLLLKLEYWQAIAESNSCSYYGCIAPTIKYIFHDDMADDYDPTLIDIVQLDDVVVVVSVISGSF